ncbi:MAG: glucosaminidase domain-containing protein [Candidatus Tenebribacter mawsonii]|nr:glucosaminidase domain-containing protein [Candidatus Tenebribacter mawsonii]
MYRTKLFSIVMILVFVAFTVTDIVYASQLKNTTIFEVEQFTSVPNFSHSLTYEENIESFLSFIRPIIKSENSYIMHDRIKLINLITKFEKEKLDIENINWLNNKAEYYKLHNFSHTNKKELSYLLTRIDVIPELMVISQAAIESAYGTSGFAKRANNLFGMRTLSSSKGIVPKKRAEGSRFYVAKYETVNQSIQCYLRNLNTHKAYYDLRKIRKNFRETNEPIDAYKLANELTKYSTEGNVYVQKIRRTMKKHENEFIENI